ncbi:SusC/RagA family TonB-linked outer membrane protein [Halosquirtibacter xylanolyticus]|uniref:SusC/RagA family TonB-linked outer membrane protein n=1 Tax=Halosquirtibacter xylanolyticus TaxID=3374599 RepID=UPI003748AA18|nr:SusC/RagA family TonB-linked outer membrane protein [Prolixibacteraceae bacterium]
MRELNIFRSQRTIKVIGTIMLTASLLSPQIVFADNAKESNTIVQQQNVNTIRGTVTDNVTGERIIGATVHIVGTEIGTITDFDGVFSLKLRSDIKELRFSYLGYEDVVVAYTGQSVIDVKLKSDTKNIDEVVVTALGIKREAKKLGYAMTEVKGEEVAQSNTVSPVAALQGKSAGVSVSGSDGGAFGATKIQIRGVSTLGSNNQPIFVVDGVILDNNTSGGSEWATDSNDFGNELKNLNSDDFESVSILKGSAATALYGSRGINGAVIITTKSGGNSRGLGVTISQTTGIDYVYDAPTLQNEYGNGTISGYVGYGDKKADGSYYKFDNQHQFQTNTLDGKTYPSLPNLSGLGFGPKYDGQDVIGYDGKLTKYKAYENNIEDAYEVGMNSNTNVTIQGGNDKTHFYLSNSYNYRKGTYKNNNFDRYSFLLKGDHQISDKFKAEASVSFSQSNAANPAGNLSGYFADGTFGRSYDTNYYKDKYTSTHGGAAGSGPSDKYGQVPGTGIWFGINNNDVKQREYVVRPMAQITYNAASWIDFTVHANMNLYVTNKEEKYLGSGYKNDGGSYVLGSSYRRQQTIKALMNVRKDISESIGFNMMVGAELYERLAYNTQVKTDGGLIIPGQFYIKNSKKNVIGSGGLSQTEKMNSIYALASFSYKDDLFLDITGRNDWSSTLVYTNETGNYSYFYPSVSASWIASNTFELPAMISFLKLRGSWAQVGSGTGVYRINQGYKIESLETAGSFNYRMFQEPTMISPDLKPERKTSYEFGLDLRMFNSRVNIDAAVYQETTNDQIIRIPAPEASGVSGQIVNAGEIKNSGIELAVNTTPIKTRNFQWDLNFNYAKNKNEIVYLHPTVGEYKVLAGSPGYGNFRVGSAAYIGGEYGVLLSDSNPAKFQATDADGKNIADARNGKNVLVWDDNARGAYAKRSGKIEKVGSIMPDFEGSISTSLSYKSFSISALFDMRFGGEIISYNNRYGTAYGHTEESLKYRDKAHGGMAWDTKYADDAGMSYSDGLIPDGVFATGTTVTTPSGAKQDVSGMTYQNAYEKGYVEPTHASYHHYRSNSWGQGTVHDGWVSEVNYISLRQLTINYALPKQMLSKVGIKNINLSLVGRNLGYIYNSLPNNLNPEGLRGNRSDYSYFERNFTPYTATYSLAVKFNL